MTTFVGTGVIGTEVVGTEIVGTEVIGNGIGSSAALPGRGLIATIRPAAMSVARSRVV